VVRSFRKKQATARREAPQAEPATATQPPRWSWWQWFVLNATVFIAAACIMTVEILSTRLVARFLGSSLYTWTSAIGVVLAGISLGNYIGGWLADRYHPRRTLSLLFIGSSLACATIPLINAWLGAWTAFDGLAWPTRIFLHFVLAFLMPATMLGTMSPVVAKMALDLGRGTGRTIGTIYAWATVGSIVGTFTAGFFLVATMGTESSILLIAAVLALVGIYYGYRSWVPYAWTATYITALLLAVGLGDSLSHFLGIRDPSADLFVFHEDSQYQRVVVQKASATHRLMVLDALMHSQVNLNDPLDLKYGYQPIYAEVMRASHPTNRPVTALFIGGGGLVFPRYVEVAYPGSYLEVAEIDPVVTQAAFEAFGVPEDTAIRCFDMDARNRVSDLVRRKRAGEEVPVFDFVFGDAINDYNVPFHLTTLEFNRLLAELLSDDGVYLLNLVDAYDVGLLLGTVINTCHKVFPHVNAFAAKRVGAGRNTFVVVSSKRPLNLVDVLAAIKSRHGVTAGRLGAKDLERLERITAGGILTDDFAPVENLLAEVVRRYPKERSWDKHDAVEIAALFIDGEFDQVLARCREVLADDPRAVEMHYWMGAALARQRRYNEAIAAYRTELGINPRHVKAHLAMATALETVGQFQAAAGQFQAALGIDPVEPESRVGLGRALLKLGRSAQAEAEFREVMRIRPRFVNAHLQLGMLLVARGDFDSARSTLEQARSLDPELPELHNQIGITLASTGELEPAVKALLRAVELKPDESAYRANLGQAYQGLGRAADAVTQYRECLNLDSENSSAMKLLAWLLATSPEENVRDGPGAVSVAERFRDVAGPNNPTAQDTLAAAYAEAGRFTEAVSTAQHAVSVAESLNNADLASAIRGRLALYEAGRAYRVGP